MKIIKISILFISFSCFLCCNNEIDYSSLESYKCQDCKEHFDSNFELKYETLPLITRGNQIAVDGPDWNKVAERKFGKVSKIKMCREGIYKEFKKHLYCYIGLDYKTMTKIIPTSAIKKYKTSDTIKYFNIELEVGKALKYPEITWIGTWKTQLYFKKSAGEFKFLGDNQEKETLENCLNIFN